MSMRIHHKQDGITLLITLLLTGVLLGVSTSLLNVTLKQFQLSGISNASEAAFQSASAGMECIRFHDQNKDGVAPDFPASRFDVNEISSTTQVIPETGVLCMGALVDDASTTNATVQSGEEQRFQFSWGTPAICSDVSIYKFYDTVATVPMIIDGVNFRPTPAGNGCPVGVRCTIIQSRGYNVGCGEINAGGRVVEREYTQIY